MAVAVAVGVEVGVGVLEYPGFGVSVIGVFVDVTVELVASARGVIDGSSSVAFTTTLVEVDRSGITVNAGVRMVMVESMGGKVGIAPQDDSTKVKNTRIRNFGIDFISFSL